MKKTREKIVIRITSAIVLLFVASYLIYYFPVQRILATNQFETYISKQGIKKSDIKTKKVHKDYTQGGYYIDVTYKDE